MLLESTGLARTGREIVKLEPPTRLLVIDDEALIGTALRRLLTPATVECATDPVAALEGIRAGSRYSAVLCDLMMPVLSGFELFEAVLEIVPELEDRFVFITGSPESPLARRVRARGRPPLLEKPFDVALLRATLAAIPDL